MTLTMRRHAGLLFASAAAFALAGCESSGQYRVASVGSVSPSSDSGNGSSISGDGSNGSGGSGGATAGTGGNGSGSGSGGTGSGGASNGNLLVTAGNTVIGVAGKHNEIAQLANAKIPATGIVTGTVTRVLGKTGQTLVALGGSGNTLILPGLGGKVGDLLRLDLGNGTVVGGPAKSPLIGLNLLAANPATGKLATVSAASSGNLVSVTVPGTTNTGLLGSATGGLGGGNGGLLGGAAAKVGTLTGGLTSGVTGTLTDRPSGTHAPQQGTAAKDGGVLPAVTGLLKPR